MKLNCSDDHERFMDAQRAFKKSTSRSLHKRIIRLLAGKRVDVAQLTFSKASLFVNEQPHMNPVALAEIKMALEQHGVVAITGIMAEESWREIVTALGSSLEEFGVGRVKDVALREWRKNPLEFRNPGAHECYGGVHENVFGSMDRRLVLPGCRFGQRRAPDPVLGLGVSMQKNFTQKKVVEFLAKDAQLVTILYGLTMGAHTMLGQCIPQLSSSKHRIAHRGMTVDDSLSPSGYGVLFDLSESESVRFVPNSHDPRLGELLVQANALCGQYHHKAKKVVRDARVKKLLRSRSVVFPANSLILWKRGMVTEEFRRRAKVESHGMLEDLGADVMVRLGLSVCNKRTMSVQMRERLAYLTECGIGPDPFMNRSMLLPTVTASVVPDRFETPSSFERDHWAKVTQNGPWRKQLEALPPFKALLFGL